MSLFNILGSSTAGLTSTIVGAAANFGTATTESVTATVDLDIGAASVTPIADLVTNADYGITTEDLTRTTGSFNTADLGLASTD